MSPSTQSFDALGSVRVNFAQRSNIRFISVDLSVETSGELGFDEVRHGSEGRTKSFEVEGRVRARRSAHLPMLRG